MSEHVSRRVAYLGHQQLISKKVKYWIGKMHRQNHYQNKRVVSSCDANLPVLLWKWRWGLPVAGYARENSWNSSCSCQSIVLRFCLCCQVYYHLGSYEDSLMFALGAGNMFDVNGHSEFVETTIGEWLLMLMLNEAH